MRKKNTLSVPILIFMIGLCAVGYIQYQQYLHVLQREEQEFIRIASGVVEKIRLQAKKTTSVFDFVEPLYLVQEDVSRTAFSIFAVNMLAANSAVRALEWVPIVSQNERDFYEQRAWIDGFSSFHFKDRRPDGSIKPSPVREIYYPVYFVEPLKGNEKALGLDLGASADRREAIEKAIREADIIASKPISLVQAEAGNKGMLLFKPIYDAHGQSKGVIVAVYQLEVLLRANQLGLDYQSMDIYYKVSDITDTNPVELIDTAKKGSINNKSLFSRTYTVNLADRFWQVEVKNIGASRIDIAIDMLKASINYFLLVIFIAYIFYQMASRQARIDELVQEKTSELHQHKTNLEQLVQERTEALEFNAKMAEEANAAKTEFLANMSHELRTPMHAIMSFSKLTMEKLETWPIEKVKQKLESIYNSAHRLHHLLNNLLDISKMEAGKEQFNIKKENLRHILQEVINELSVLYEEKRQAVDFDERVAEQFYLMCDREKTHQAIYNLMSNAAKFSPQGGVVKLTFEQELHGDQQMIHLQVIDQGVGIPENELDSIFDKFIQSSHTKTGAGGTGLGLAICRRIVEDQGGKVWAQNNISGVGASMHILLPLAD